MNRVERRIQMSDKEVQFPKPVSESDQLDVEINGELAKWDEANMNPMGINLVGWKMDVKIAMIIRLLKERLGMTKEDIDLEFKKQVLLYLREFRENNEEEVKEARRQALVAQSMPAIKLPPKKFH